jgi:secreted trypsin-like serine protease
MVLVVNLVLEKLCTGAIINDKFVLLASHCVDHVTSGDQMKVYHDQEHSNIDSIVKGTPLKVKDVLRRERKRKNDIALLELEERLVFTDTISPICLTPKIEHDNYFAAGWGYQKKPKWDSYSYEWHFYKEPTNTSLSEIPLRRIPDKECLKQFDNPNAEVLANQICFKGLKEGHILKQTKSNLCRGDNGGPLMTRDKNGRVSTFGVATNSDCNVSFYKTSFYEKIIAHKEWIDDNTKDAVWCQGSSDFFA